MSSANTHGDCQAAPQQHVAAAQTLCSEQDKAKQEMTRSEKQHKAGQGGSRPAPRCCATHSRAHDQRAQAGECAEAFLRVPKIIEVTTSCAGQHACNHAGGHAHAGTLISPWMATSARPRAQAHATRPSGSAPSQVLAKPHVQPGVAAFPLLCRYFAATLPLLFRYFAATLPLLSRYFAATLPLLQEW